MRQEDANVEVGMQMHTNCPECGGKIVNVGSKDGPMRLAKRLEDLPRPEDLSPTLLTCENGHVITPVQRTLMMSAGGSQGLRVEFELAAKKDEAR